MFIWFSPTARHGAGYVAMPAVLAWTLLAVGTPAPQTTPPAVGAAEPRAGLVVQFGDGSVSTYCVALGGPSVTGLDLLERSGLALRTEVSSLGTMVCRIGTDGCTAEES